MREFRYLVYLFLFQMKQLNEQIENLKQLEKDLVQMKLKDEHSNERIKTLEAEAEKNKESLSDTQRTEETLRSKLSAIEADKNALVSKVSALKEDLDSRDKIVSALKDNIKEEIEQKLQFLSEVETLKNEVDKLTTDNNKVKEKLVESEASNETNSSSLFEVRNELTQKIKESASLQEQLSSKSQELNEVQESLSQRLELSERNSVQMTEQLELNTSQIADMTKKNSDLSDKLASIEIEKQKLSKENTSAVQKFQESETRCTQLNTDIKNIAADKASLEHQNKTLQNEVEQLISQISDASDIAAENVIKHAAELEDIQLKLNMSEDSLEKERSENSAKLKEVEDKLNESSTHVSEEQTRAEEAEIQLATLQAQLAEVQGDKLEFEVRLKFSIITNVFAASSLNIATF